jgi:hypothetical protein
VKYNNVFNLKVCSTCVQADSTVHCEDCDVCIEGFDHHCPWTGKCIGKRNVLYFYWFVTMIPIYIIFFLGVALSR